MLDKSTKRLFGKTLTIFLLSLLSNIVSTVAVRRQILTTVTTCRGGQTSTNSNSNSLVEIRVRAGSVKHNNEPIELNPDYHRYVSASRNEHEAWLQQQQQHQQQQQEQNIQTTFSLGRRNEPSWMERTQNYFVMLYELSPSLYWTTLSCIGVFGMWQVPRFTRRSNYPLYKLFVNSRANLKQTFGLSLILSSLSHISPYHLIVNLVTLSQLGPNVKSLLQHKQSSRFVRTFRPFHPRPSAIWPLLVSSALFSNALFLLAARQGSSSLGLSGVTMALMAIQARAYPDRRYGMIIGVIPISLQAKHLLQLLLVVSIIGSWSSSSFTRQPRVGGGSNIAHLAHLGGLLYGILYYDWIILGLTPYQVLQKMVRSMSFR